MPTLHRFEVFVDRTLSGLAVPLEVFLRHGFGVRYLDGRRLIGAGALYAACTLGGLLWSKATGAPAPVLMVLFGPLWLAAAAYHRWKIHRRGKRGVLWHSRYSGTPLLLGVLPGDYWTHLRVIEPVLSSVLAVLVLQVDPPLGCALIAAIMANLTRNDTLYCDLARSRCAAEMTDVPPLKWDREDRASQHASFRQMRGR